MGSRGAVPARGRGDGSNNGSSGPRSPDFRSVSGHWACDPGLVLFRSHFESPSHACLPRPPAARACNTGWPLMARRRDPPSWTPGISDVPPTACSISWRRTPPDTGSGSAKAARSGSRRSTSRQNSTRGLCFGQLPRLGDMHGGPPQLLPAMPLISPWPEVQIHHDRRCGPRRQQLQKVLLPTRRPRQSRAHLQQRRRARPRYREQQRPGWAICRKSQRGTC